MLKRTWRAKFRDAFRGIRFAVTTEKSFRVHFAGGVLVVAAAAIFRVTTVEWCVLGLCVVLVLVAEAFNSSIESLSRAVTDKHDEHIGRALDIAAGAVLLMSIGAAIVGVTIFVPYVMALLSGSIAS